MALAMFSTIPHPHDLDNPAVSAPNQNPCPMTFEFTWKSNNFVAQITKDMNSKDPLLTITCHIGWLPYTAENNLLRAKALKILRQYVTKISGKFTILRDGRINFTQKTRLPGLGSKPEIIQALALCLLQAQPYLKTAQNSLISS